MRLPRDRGRLVPPAVLLLLAGVAFFVTENADARPRTQVHRRATAYLEALGEGRAAEAGAFRVPPVSEDTAQRIRWRRTALWRIVRIDVSGDGREAGVVVAWDPPRVSGAEQLIWARARDGTWWLTEIRYPVPAR